VRSALRSGRLHDPDSRSDRFRWLTISDENPYDKGYEEYERSYPEVRSARYREVVDETKETSLTIRCDRGALSLAGSLRASQFRAWCLDRLGQVVGVLDSFRANPPEYVRTHGLATAPELSKFNAAQRKQVLALLSTLLTLKQAPHLGHRALGTSPLDLAATMGRFVLVQIPFECPEFGCDEEGTIGCRACGATTFTLGRRDEAWQVECREHRRKPWTCALPFEGQCEQEHPFKLDAGDLAEEIELLPSEDLLEIVSQVVNRHLAGYNFDPQYEGFIVRGPNLIYYPDVADLRITDRDGAETIFYVTQTIDRVEKGGKVIGVIGEIWDDARLVGG
jgi:hypothetical protein